VSLKIQYICFTGTSGFATAAKNNIKVLLKGNYDVSIFPLDTGFKKIIDTKNFELFSNLCAKKEKPDIQIYHCLPFMCRRVPKVAKTIGYAVFEANSVPLNWISSLNKNDAVVVPSMFNYNLFKDKINTKLFYLPHCLDFPEKELPKISSGNYRFLFFATWKKRKNYLSLLQAFSEEFSKNEKAELVLKTNKDPYGDPEKVIKQFNGKITLDLSILKSEEVLPYINNFDCLISTSLGEAFYIPALQAIAVKVPIIVPDHSGFQEYASSQTALLLSPDGLETLPEIDGIVQFRNQTWPTISIKQIREKMRYAFENRDKMKELAENAYIFAKNKFNYESILKIFETIIAEI
jgi:glycosyltransferase involved in cell wall biosynthesis